MREDDAALGRREAIADRDRRRAWRVLAMNTVAFTVCFAAWTMNGVLVTFLVDHGVYAWDRAQVGWLIGTPILTGALLRLPVGMLTDRFGGRVVFSLLMLGAALPMYVVSRADSYLQFILLGLGFGLSGASFAVGVAYTSVWFPARLQGTVLGIFGMGNLGTGLTLLGAPLLLTRLTGSGTDLEGWRHLPRVYAAALAAMAVLFWLLTCTRKAGSGQGLSLARRLLPLRETRVWRFGLYYFFVFGGFVALSQWLVPYYVNVYSLSVTSAGLMAALFSLPAGVIRAVGGWASDRWGARAILYLVFGAGTVVLVLLFPPRMEILAPGQGVMAERAGIVTAVTEDAIVVGQDRYVLATGTRGGAAKIRFGIHAPADAEGFLVWPDTSFAQVPLVRVGDAVQKGQLLARGETRVYFQANRWIFTGLVFLLGILLGIGSAAVYKLIPTYYPESVGVVGGLVGVIGALGGFFGPVAFGYLLQATGVWTTAWMFLALVAVACLIWMHLTIRHRGRARAPVLARQIEEAPAR